METKKVYYFQTVLLIIYLALTPLLVSQDPLLFHELKLATIYTSIFLLFIISLFFYHNFREEYILLFKTFKTERYLIIIAFAMMFISFALNYNRMSAEAIEKSLGSIMWYGAAPNYLSIIFYSSSLFLIIAGIVSLKYINRKLIATTVVGSLVLVGSIIIYQIFIEDFLGRGQGYLFGWGNTNYVPDSFSIVGLMLLMPILFKQKMNYLNLGIAIFFLEIVFLSVSRAAFLALFISVIISSMVLYFKKKTTFKRILILYGSAILITFASYFLFTELGFKSINNDIDSLGTVLKSNESEKDLISSRVDLWTVSLDLFVENPYSVFFGKGQSVYMWDTKTTHYLVSNTHNQYIDILLSSGIIVFFIFMTLLFKQYVYVLRLVKYDINNIALLSGLIFITVKWIFNSLNAIHSPFILMVFVLISYRYMIMQKKRLFSNN